MASNDRKEFEKYLKFLTYKVAQVVIQSKQGRKIRTKSTPHGNEWFNVTIQDDKLVSNELKRSLEGRLPQQDSPVCVEISMETLEGDSLVLEVWSVAIDYSRRDIGVSVTHLLYPRFSLVLKSLIALSRTTPSYRLSRQQEDTLKFNFRIYARPPEGTLGFKTVEFAKTVCPYGTVALSLSYREKIVFPDRSSRGSMLEEPNTLLEGGSGSVVGEALYGKPLTFPFASSESSTQQLKQECSPGSLQSFSAILPRPTDNATLSSPSSLASRQDSENNNYNAYSREDSDQTSRSFFPNEADSFIMVDLEKIVKLYNFTRRACFQAMEVGRKKPTFASSDNDEISQFLHLSCEVPDLDMFSGEGSMDVTAAMEIVGNKS